MTPASSPHAAGARSLVEALQTRFSEGLEDVARVFDEPLRFAQVTWLRDEGRHGGGVRASAEGGTFDRASVNVSQVHYDDLPDRKLSSATALSAIVHPDHPRLPSVHIHISYTELRKGPSYWRLMADLNPAIPLRQDAQVFAEALGRVAPEDVYQKAVEQGDRYFYIPALQRYRGAAHFYLEAYFTGDFESDIAFAKEVGEVAIDTYLHILRRGLLSCAPASDEERCRQLAYHTLYVFQVLTLDRGTTSGLLVHDQNDVGILGSLPGRIDRELLRSWSRRVPHPQEELVHEIVRVLSDAHPCPIGPSDKERLAQVVRSHYRAHPEALDLQASGGVAVPTVSNHGPSSADQGTG